MQAESACMLDALRRQHETTTIAQKESKPQHNFWDALWPDHAFDAVPVIVSIKTSRSPALAHQI